MHLHHRKLLLLTIINVQSTLLLASQSNIYVLKSFFFTDKITNKFVKK